MLLSSLWTSSAFFFGSRPLASRPVSSATSSPCWGIYRVPHSRRHRLMTCMSTVSKVSFEGFDQEVGVSVGDTVSVVYQPRTTSPIDGNDDYDKLVDNHLCLVYG